MLVPVIGKQACSVAAILGIVITNWDCTLLECVMMLPSTMCSVVYYIQMMDMCDTGLQLLAWCLSPFLYAWVQAMPYSSHLERQLC